jgi:hypothetical protein
MNKEKVEFCIRLGMAMPLSATILVNLEALGYLNCFHRLDVDDNKGVDIYIVMTPILLKLSEERVHTFLNGDVFHVRGSWFRCFPHSGEPEDYNLTC